MTPFTETRWQQFPVGQPEFVQAAIGFNRRDWDLPVENFLGARLNDLAHALIKQSRFHPTMFNPESWIGDYHGGIFRTLFKPYHPQPHEIPQAYRRSETGSYEFWISAEVDPHGNLTNHFLDYDPTQDPTFNQQTDYAIGWGSKVMLNNLTLPGESGGWAHFPMLDFIKPPTKANVNHIIHEVIRRCGIDTFFVLRSSDHGMMLVGPELIDETHLLVFWNNALLMNHYETGIDDVWVDPRWVSRSQQNFINELGLPNRHQVCAILRLTSAPPLKPGTPTVIAAVRKQQIFYPTSFTSHHEP